jgi:hypothetical protein
VDKWAGGQAGSSQQRGSQSVRDAVDALERGGPMARDRRQVLHQSSPVPVSPNQPVQLLHQLPDIRLCYNSPDTPVLSPIQGSPSDMLVPWLTSWSPSLFGGGDSRLRDGDHGGWDAWMAAAECSSHPCNHATMQPCHPCSRHLSYHHTPLPLPPRARLTMPSTNLHLPLFVYNHVVQ